MHETGCLGLVHWDDPEGWYGEGGLAQEVQSSIQLVRESWGLLSSHFRAKQGNRPTGHDQEGRRGLNEVVPGTSVVPSSETGMSRHFWGRIKGAKYFQISK